MPDNFGRKTPVVGVIAAQPLTKHGRPSVAVESNLGEEIGQIFEVAVVEELAALWNGRPLKVVAIEG